MTRSLEQQMADIRDGRSVQFSLPIQIKAAQLSAYTEIEVKLPGLASALWLPPIVVMPDYSTILQNVAVVLGVRINLQSAPMLAWGMSGNLVAQFTGPIERIFVRNLGGVSADMFFYAARGIGISYSGGNTAAGTPSSSPSFGGGGNTQS